MKMTKSIVRELLQDRWTIYESMGACTYSDLEKRERFFWFLVGMGSLTDTDRTLFMTVFDEMVK